MIQAPEGTECDDILWRIKRPHTIPVLMLKKAGFLTMPYRAVKLRNEATGSLPSRSLVFLLIVLPDALIFFFGGLYLTFVGTRKKQIFPLSWVWLSTLGLALLTLAVPRHLFPAMPFFILGTFLFIAERPRIQWWMWVAWCAFFALLVFAWVFWCVPFYAHHPFR